jgi:hemoglobin
MNLSDISSRTDIHLLVRTFYAKVQVDELLGPIFNRAINDWEHHFEHLTNFWESNLFYANSYKGNPMEKHAEVDAANHGTINEMHFGVWLNLWYQTIDSLFIGDTAQIAKNRARNMSTFIHLKIFEARQNRTKE